MQKAETSTVFRNINAVFSKILRFAKMTGQKATACLYIFTTNKMGKSTICIVQVSTTISVHVVRIF
jgi:effector-binding domain-containing protein